VVGLDYREHLEAENGEGGGRGVRPLQGNEGNGEKKRT
jgi:hypothetical protein